MQTCVALTNAYLYQDDFNEWYYDEFIDVADLPEYDANAFFYENEGSNFTTWFYEI